MNEHARVIASSRYEYTERFEYLFSSFVAALKQANCVGDYLITGIAKKAQIGGRWVINLSVLY
jgi:hypothetical protein